MFTRIRNMHPVSGIVIGVVATLVLSGTAIAITDTSFAYTTAQTGYLMIGPGDLVPHNANSANNYQLDPGAATGGGSCFVAPVHLPQGARMISVRTSYFSGAASNPSIHLSRENPVTALGAVLINRTVVDESGTRAYVNDLIQADRRLVNNALYIYTYQVCVGSSDVFYGARVTYQYYSAGD